MPLFRSQTVTRLTEVRVEVFMWEALAAGERPERTVHTGNETSELTGIAEVCVGHSVKPTTEMLLCRHANKSRF